MTLYSLSRITRVYDNKTVLDIDSLEIGDGSIYALLGPNGAGKTTLLNILAFLDHPTTGSIHYRSEQVSFSDNMLRRLRKKVVMVAQQPIMFTTTVYKNLEFGLKIRGISGKKRDQIIKESLELVDMKHFEQARAHKLSGGETQRVALARALALAPEVILCDEPTSSVDLENQASIIRLLKQINEQKKISLVFTTHDRLQASSLAHQTVFLEQGKHTVAAYENLFTGMLSGRGNGMALCTIHDTLKFMTRTEREGRARLLIDPEKITILENDENPAGEKPLDGRVMQIAEQNGKIRIMVDLGVYVTILVSPDLYRKHRFLVGETVKIFIPSVALRILDI